MSNASQIRGARLRRGFLAIMASVLAALVIAVAPARALAETTAEQAELRFDPVPPALESQLPADIDLPSDDTDVPTTLLPDAAVKTDDDEGDLSLQDTTLQAGGNRAFIFGNAFYDEAFEVLRLVNIERAKVSAPPLVMNESLLETSLIRGMETAIVFSHTRPNGTRCFTASSLMVAENIAAGETSAAEVVSDWMSSAGHRRNILNPSYTTIGIGCVVHRGVPYWTQCFGSGPATSNCPQPANDVIDVLTPITSGPIEDANTGETYFLDPVLIYPDPFVLAREQEETLFFHQERNPGFPYADSVFFGEGWTSSNPNVATVEDGLVTGVNEGTSHLTCNLGGFYYDLDVQVKRGVAVYRLYNPYSHEHLYTLDSSEVDDLMPLGWVDEGVAWRAPKTSDKPVYRLYNPYNKDHHYTTSLSEYNQLASHGWKGEGKTFYSADSTETPVYRLFNPYNHGPGAHHYTMSTNERSNLLHGGWKDENISWYGYA